MSSPAAVIIRPTYCAGCPNPLPPPKGNGRPRQYCSEACKSRRKRFRRALPWPPVAPASYPADPETVRRRSAEALVAVLEGQPEAPPEDQLAQGLLELDWLVFQFARLERDLPPRLAGRTGELARRITEAKALAFPGLEAAVET